MSWLRSLLRDCLPAGLVEHRRRTFRLRRLGLSPGLGESRELEVAVLACRYDLWPSFLRSWPHDWTLVDVGANEGSFLEGALRLARPAAVVACEPLPACRERLTRILAGVPRGRLVQMVVGSVTGTAELHCTRNPKLTSVLVPREDIKSAYDDGDYSVIQMLTTSVTRLDDIVTSGDRVGLLKVDVQGYELEVLQGGMRTLRQTDALLIEVNYVPHYAGSTSFDDLHSFLRNTGFSLHGVSEPYCSQGRPLWADAMYVRSAGER
jgi:FkbM family methyltransferase